MTLEPRRSARMVAVDVVTRVLRDGRSLSAALDRAAEQLDDGRERGLAKELAFGVFRWLPRLNLVLPQLMDRPLKRKDVEVQAILLLGLYQLLFTRIPAHAAVAESVSLARGLGKPWSSGLVNAVLRRFQRERAEILERVLRNAQAAYAHPTWLIDAARSSWPSEWQDILEAGNRPPPMSLRVNALKSSRSAYLKRLQASGIGAQPAPFTSHGLTLDKPSEVSELPGFSRGLVSVQDAAAQLAAPLLELTPGLRVLDACAAPGGKTAHMLEIQPELRAMVAVDSDAQRLHLLEDTLERLGLACKIVQGDAAKPQGWWDGVRFERILLDAPCTASGVIRRRPDIKHHRRESDIEGLVRLQRSLLEGLWPLLARGGLVLYATCSFLPQENQQQVAKFVESRSDAALSPMNCEWGRPARPGRQILPGDHGMDGFYYALLAKS